MSEVDFPCRSEVKDAVVLALSNKPDGLPLKKLYSCVSDLLAAELSDDMLKRRQKGGDSAWENRIRWAVRGLKVQNQVVNIGRGVWALKLPSTTYIDELPTTRDPLLASMAFHIASLLIPQEHCRVRQVFVGGGTKQHLFFRIGQTTLFSFNLFAQRLDQIDDPRIEDEPIFRQILEGQDSFTSVAQRINSAFGWERTEEDQGSYSVGLLGLGLLMQRFAFEPDLRYENGYVNPFTRPRWLTIVDELYEWPGLTRTDQFADCYWLVNWKDRSVIFDLSEACVYLLNPARSIIELGSVNRLKIREAITAIESYLRSAQV